MALKPLPPLPGLPAEALAAEYDDAYVEKYVYDKNGVDRGLIWENLQRTPEERLGHLEGFLLSVNEVRENSATPSLPTRFSELLRVLQRHRVEFVVVGAAAANLLGIDISTLDLDIVFRQDEDNRKRLAAALEEVEAAYFDPAGRTIAPTPERPRDNRLNLLRTRLGRLDVLSKIAGEWDFDELRERHSSPLPFGGGTVLVISLEGLIEAKEAAGRPKDLQTLPLLRAALELRRSRDSSR